MIGWRHFSLPVHLRPKKKKSSCQILDFRSSPLSQFLLESVFCFYSFGEMSDIC